jgi:hypothetical protein
MLMGRGAARHQPRARRSPGRGHRAAGRLREPQKDPDPQHPPTVRLRVAAAKAIRRYIMVSRRQAQWAAAESPTTPPGPRWGRAPSVNDGQQRRTTVSRPRRSAAVSERLPRSRNNPDCLSHGARHLRVPLRGCPDDNSPKGSALSRPTGCTARGSRPCPASETSSIGSAASSTCIAGALRRTIKASGTASAAIAAPSAACPDFHLAPGSDVALGPLYED